MNENSLDIDPGMRDNVTNDVYEHVVKMDEQAPVNDIECRHETLVADPTDTIGEAVYHGCANKECGVGFYLKK